jgi:hypothetical protein
MTARLGIWRHRQHAQQQLKAQAAQPAIHHPSNWCVRDRFFFRVFVYLRICVLFIYGGAALHLCIRGRSAAYGFAFESGLYSQFVYDILLESEDRV